jgi:hypothetical protein
MRRIAVPMVGGMVSSTVLTLLVIGALRPGQTLAVAPGASHGAGITAPATPGGGKGARSWIT